MNFLLHFVGSAVSTVLVQVIFSRRGLRRRLLSAVLAALIWYPTFHLISYAEWEWKIGPFDWGGVTALFMTLNLVLWALLMLPFSAATAWLCKKIGSQPQLN